MVTSVNTATRLPNHTLFPMTTGTICHTSTAIDRLDLVKTRSHIATEITNSAVASNRSPFICHDRNVVAKPIVIAYVDFRMRAAWLN